jgi:hypothetical protein
MGVKINFTIVIFPTLLGFFIGGHLNAKKAVVLLDKLGNEYSLSRVYKQTIFSKRKDLPEELKAEIYMKMNKENEKLENSIVKKYGYDKI